MKAAFIATGPNEAAYLDAIKLDPCGYCDEAGGILDHIRARADGGGNQWWNATGSCPKCNMAKGPRSLLGFLGGRLNKSRFEAEHARIYAESKTWVNLGRSV